MARRGEEGYEGRAWMNDMRDMEGKIRSTCRGRVVW